MMIPVASFDQISVVSDLHIGGPPGFQVFDQAPLLAAYIHHLRQTGLGDCALVMNGDVFDFLAEPDARCFDPEGATGKLDRIFEDRAFVPVWEALRQFVTTPKRHLVITLGNHDLELALAWVQEHLRKALGGCDSAAAARITMACDGAGFACRVGNASILCIHGNEVDTWNGIDHEAMRRLTRDLVQWRPAARRAVEEWTPNAGSKLVIEVMNDIKREYAFIDLLKPEQEGAVRILLAMKPDLRPKLVRVCEVAARCVWDRARRAVGWLSVEPGMERSAQAEHALERSAGGYAQPVVDAEALLDRAEEQFRQATDPLDMTCEQEEFQLGLWDALVGTIRRRPPFEIAWEAVKEIAHDTSFDIHRADADFKRIDGLAGPAFDYVIAGHTHLARVLRRVNGPGLYFNTGTWATLMRLTPQQLESPQTFQPVFDRLMEATTVNELGELVSRRPTAVTVQSRNGRTEAALELVTVENGMLTLKTLE